jgi:hypothetical protein
LVIQPGFRRGDGREADQAWELLLTSLLESALLRRVKLDGALNRRDRILCGQAVGMLLEHRKQRSD